MQERKPTEYQAYILEIESLLNSLNRLNKESNTNLFSTPYKSVFKELKEKANLIYEKYPDFKRRIHFVDYSGFEKLTIKLTYTLKYKRISSCKKIDNAYSTLLKFKPEVADVIQPEDFVSGAIKAYEKSVENRVYCSYTLKKNVSNEQFNVGIGTVILIPEWYEFNVGEATEKRIDRLMVSDQLLKTNFEYQFKLSEDLKILYDIISI